MYQTQPNVFYGYYTVGYFILRAEGNILIDAPEEILEYQEDLSNLGGIKYHYLTHSHKQLTTKTLVKLKERYGVTTERPGLDYWQKQSKSIETKELATDVSLLFTPGHTEDSVIVTWRDQETIRWFTGDTVYITKGKLDRSVAFTEDNSMLNRTLELMKNLKVDHIYSAIGDNRDRVNLRIENSKEWKEQLTKCQEKFRG